MKEVVQTVQEIFADYNPYSGKRVEKIEVSSWYLSLYFSTEIRRKDDRNYRPERLTLTRPHKPDIGVILNSLNFISAHLFTIPLNKMNPFQIDETDLRRSSEGLMALLLSLS